MTRRIGLGVISFVDREEEGHVVICFRNDTRELCEQEVACDMDEVWEGVRIR